jgi:hypothetical protein
MTFNLQLANEIEFSGKSYEMRERFGLHPKSGRDEGILADNPEDCIFWFSNGAYFDPESPQCIFLTGDSYDLWDRTEVWGQIKPAKILWDLSPDFVVQVGTLAAPFGGGSTLGSANIYTYRSADFMLSSAQNYHRKLNPLQILFELLYYGNLKFPAIFQLVMLLVNSNHGKLLWIQIEKGPFSAINH